MMARVFRIFVLLGMTLTFVGCAQNSLQIGTNLTLCCPGTYSEYTEYGLSVENMPLFLRDYVVAEFDEAFQEKGLERNDQINDIRVVLSYNHINLNSQQQDVDPFVRVESISVQLDYVARIEIEMIETRSNDVVWGGTISRIHQVIPGEYMHEDRARPAFLQAFRNVLASYPPLFSDDS
ncbi:MAG: hypothetical protein GKR91_15700 [Pseudomonadales bacterium]|nr:hypothetical protein [Pseudomonadales bacterium]